MMLRHDARSSGVDMLRQTHARSPDKGGRPAVCPLTPGPDKVGVVSSHCTTVGLSVSHLMPFSELGLQYCQVVKLN